MCLVFAFIFTGVTFLMPCHLCCFPLLYSYVWHDSYIILRPLVWQTTGQAEIFFEDRPHEKLHGIRRVSNPSTSIDPGSLNIGLLGFLVLIQITRFVRDNGTNQPKEGYRGRKPVSEKLLGRCIRRCIRTQIQYFVIHTQIHLWFQTKIHTQIQYFVGGVLSNIRELLGRMDGMTSVQFSLLLFIFLKWLMYHFCKTLSLTNYRPSRFCFPKQNRWRDISPDFRFFFPQVWHTKIIHVNILKSKQTRRKKS